MWCDEVRVDITVCYVIPILLERPNRAYHPMCDWRPPVNFISEVTTGDFYHRCVSGYARNNEEESDVVDSLYYGLLKNFRLLLNFRTACSRWLIIHDLGGLMCDSGFSSAYFSESWTLFFFLK